MESRRLSKNMFSIISIIGLSFFNLSHIVFTISVVMEEIETGWGRPTSLEMAVLFPWMLEIFLGVPSIILAILSFSLLPKAKSNKVLFIFTICLLVLALIQMFLFNLFIYN